MQALFAQILALLDSAYAQAGIAAVVVDFLLRLIPSQKPLGVLYLVADAAKGAGAVFAKLGGLLDKVLPQRIAPPSA